ncbi:hypothetical protein H9W90_02410 [Polaribacter pectinis]|uniref:SF3 helicase domain-containing protein n=1 Tax=Polaribacter pectinis TaxID=2738844 RepID=A0A7G9LBI7_9FLAO|nr:primase-helicase family protein [Polaribacter pectinis]QNM85986.1 hypothetical protein H9W90_02410 [Polaribacter pectinis]
MILERETPFWRNDDKGNIKIVNSELLKFLADNGFVRIKLADANHILVKNNNNRIRITSEAEMIAFVGDYLKKIKENKVYEMFVSSVGNLINNKKLSFLPVDELPRDRDRKDSGIFYYQNCYSVISEDGIEVKEYSELPYVIWESRIIKHDYVQDKDKSIGQFQQFCFNISKKDENRFLSLKTILGYLLHRCKIKDEAKAIILYDENMVLNDKTNGGTGKTLLSIALSKVRDLELFDGKSIKNDSWFKNQRINLTTDIITYDDLNKTTSLELFYSMITTGVEVEKKRKDAFYIKHEDSPKIIITSNYPVKGPGGSSDLRRRFEFEVANYYDEEFTPEKEFGNMFFNEDWGIEEWQKFYHFLMECLTSYLKYGLVKATPINYNQKKLEMNTSKEFLEFADDFLDFNFWDDKREAEALFKECYPEETISPHRFNKWLKEYCFENDAELETKSTGSNYLFKMTKNVKGDEEDCVQSNK